MDAPRGRSPPGPMGALSLAVDPHGTVVAVGAGIPGLLDRPEFELLGGVRPTMTLHFARALEFELRPQPGFTAIEVRFQRRAAQSRIETVDPVPHASRPASRPLPPNAQLEAEFAREVGRRYCVALNSCGSSMFVALRCAGVQPGDKVLSNCFTLAPVPGAIAHAGAQPVLVDCTDDLTLDLDDLAHKAAASGARVLLLSHMRGHIADMDRVLALCRAHGLTLIEDCAHTMGAGWDGRLTGTFGVAGCFSLQSYKHANAGEGGLLVTDDADLAAHYQAADIFCLPSVTQAEAFGIVQVEAMACGKPVVSTRLNNGVDYVNQDGVTGLVVTPGDAAELRRAISRLLDEPALAARLGSNGRAKAIEEYSLGSLRERTLSVYRAAIGTRSE